MKVKRTIEVEEEFTPKPYMKTPYDYMKLLPNGRILRVNESLLNYDSRITAFDVERTSECTKADFDAAYDRAVQNIREAYLS